MFIEKIGAGQQTREKGSALSGVLTRSWGIMNMDEAGTQQFHVLIPGGKRLFAGYQAHCIARPFNSDNTEVPISVFSAPASWNQGDDVALLRREAVLRVSSPNTQFPRRKLRIDMSLSDSLNSLLVSVVDLTSERRVERQLGVALEEAPKFEEMSRGGGRKKSQASARFDAGSWSAYYTSYYSDPETHHHGAIQLRR